MSEGKYKFPNNKIVELPPNYSTNSEDENNAINILNEDLSKWESQINKPNLKIYSKLTKVTDMKNEKWDTAMIYVDATIDKSAAAISERLSDVDLMEKMGEEKSKTIDIKETDNEKIIDQYGNMKMPFPFSNRDFVTRYTVLKNYGGIQGSSLSYVKSIEHPDYPEKSSPVRAEFANRVLYVKKINENQCKLFIVNNVNLKVSLGTSFMGGKGAKMQEEWVKKLTQIA